MQIEETENQPSPKKQQGKSTKHWWCIGLALLLVLAAFYVAGRADKAVAPWVWNRGDNELAQQSSGISAWAGFTTSTINTSAGSTTSHSGYSLIDVSSIAVRAKSDHPLAIACAEKIAEQLKTIPDVKRIVFVSSGAIIGKDDEPLPPWVVQVDVSDLNESTVPNRSLSGNIVVSFGVAAAVQPTMYGDDGVAPLVRFEHSAMNRVQFTHIGISSQSVFYEKVGEAVAKKAVETIAGEFDKLSQTLPPLPKLPEAFYPAYREASEVPPMPGIVSQTTLVDGRRLMLPHYSLVQLETNFAGTNEEFVNEIQKAMSEDGWKGLVNNHEIFKATSEDGQVLKRHYLYHMRLERGNETFYLFQEMRSNVYDSLNREVQALLTGNALPSPPPKARVFLLERMVKMDRDCVFAALQVLLDEHAPASMLLPFTHWTIIGGRTEAHRSLQEQIRTRLLELPTNTPAEQLAAAQFFRLVGDTDTAKEMLYKAWRVRELSSNRKPDSEYMALAKQLEVEAEMKALPPPTVEQWEEYGFILLTPENCPMEVEAELDKGARFMMIDEDERITLLQYEFRYVNGTFHKEHSQVHLREDGTAGTRVRSYMWSGSVIDQHAWSVNIKGRGDFFFRISAESPDKPLRVRVTFRR